MGPWRVHHGVCTMIYASWCIHPYTMMYAPTMMHAPWCMHYDVYTIMHATTMIYAPWCMHCTMMYAPWCMHYDVCTMIIHFCCMTVSHSTRRRSVSRLHVNIQSRHRPEQWLMHRWRVELHRSWHIIGRPCSRRYVRHRHEFTALAFFSQNMRRPTARVYNRSIAILYRMPISSCQSVQRPWNSWFSDNFFGFQAFR